MELCGRTCLDINNLLEYKLYMNKTFLKRKNKPGLLPVGSGIVGKFFDCSVPRFSHLLNGALLVAC